MSNADFEVLIECYQQYSCRNLKSISTGVYPNKLKMAKIVPIFKTDDNTDPSNYRPISLLSNFNRIFEKLIFKRMESFIEQHTVNTGV